MSIDARSKEEDKRISNHCFRIGSSCNYNHDFKENADIFGYGIKLGYMYHGSKENTHALSGEVGILLDLNIAQFAYMHNYNNYRYMPNIGITIPTNIGYKFRFECGNSIEPYLGVSQTIRLYGQELNIKHRHSVSLTEGFRFYWKNFSIGTEFGYRVLDFYDGNDGIFCKLEGTIYFGIIL